MAEQKERSIVALWEKQGPTGMYMTGVLELTEGEQIQVVMFKNDKGDNPKRPDWRIYKSKPKEAKQEPANEQKGQPNDPKEIPVDQIPF